MSMPGHGTGMGGGGGQFGPVMRSMRRDESVTQQRVTKGTARRMVSFASPYRRILAWFLVLVIVEAFIGIVNPLIFRSIINNLTGNQPDKTFIVTLALVAAGVALVDNGLTIGIRYVSAKVGEGLIYDMRSQVFEHIQRMPIAFFTRTQTGALISRLNNDVIGAQQAFTDTLSSVVSNLISVTLVLIVMFILSWQITLISLVILPIFVFPAKRVGRKLSAITRESYGLNAQMNNTMNERFNVSGALLVKLFGRPEEERAAFEKKAGRVRDIGVTQAMYAAGLHRRPHPHRGPRHRGGLRMGRRPGHRWGPHRGHGRGPGLLPDPALRTADPTVQCPDRRDDRPGLLRPGLRGARPPTDDHRSPRRPAGTHRTGDRRVRPRRLPLPERGGGLPGFPRVGRRARPFGLPAGALRRHLRDRAGPDGCPGGTFRSRQDHHQPASPPPLRRAVRRDPDQRAGSSATPPSSRSPRRWVW